MSHTYAVDLACGRCLSKSWPHAELESAVAQYQGLVKQLCSTELTVEESDLQKLSNPTSPEEITFRYGLLDDGTRDPNVINDDDVVQMRIRPVIY